MPVSRHSAFLRRLAWLGAARGPRWLLRYSPPVVGTLALAFSGDARRKVIQNLRTVRGPRGPVRDALDAVVSISSFAGALGESLATGSKNDAAPDARIEGRELLLDALPGPMIIGTIHSGGWDVLGRLLSTDLSLDVIVVMAREPDRAAEALHDAARAKANLRVVHVGQDALDALPLLRHLKSGGVVAMQLDRAPAGMRTVPVRLFDEESVLPEGPFRLAQMTGAPIVPVFCARKGFRRYEVQIHPPVRLAKDADVGQLRSAANRIAADITAFLRANPSQWFNF